MVPVGDGSSLGCAGSRLPPISLPPPPGHRPASDTAQAALPEPAGKPRDQAGGLSVRGGGGAFSCALPAGLAPTSARIVARLLPPPTAPLPHPATTFPRPPSPGLQLPALVPTCRLHVIGRLPHLKVLDYQKVTRVERQAAARAMPAGETPAAAHATFDPDEDLEEVRGVGPWPRPRQMAPLPPQASCFPTAATARWVFLVSMSQQLAAGPGAQRRPPPVPSQRRRRSRRSSRRRSTSSRQSPAGLRRSSSRQSRPPLLRQARWRRCGGWKRRSPPASCPPSSRGTPMAWTRTDARRLVTRPAVLRVSPPSPSSCSSVDYACKSFPQPRAASSKQAWCRAHTLQEGCGWGCGAGPRSVGGRRKHARPGLARCMQASLWFTEHPILIGRKWRIGGALRRDVAHCSAGVGGPGRQGRRGFADARRVRSRQHVEKFARQLQAVDARLGRSRANRAERPLLRPILELTAPCPCAMPPRARKAALASVPEDEVVEDQASPPLGSNTPPLRPELRRQYQELEAQCTILFCGV